MSPSFCDLALSRYQHLAGTLIFITPGRGLGDTSKGVGFGRRSFLRLFRFARCGRRNVRLRLIHIHALFTA